MQSKFFRAAGLAVLACSVLAISIGCAQQRAPINRVQAMALSKHFFVGPNLSDPSDNPEFYMGHRIVDEPYGVGQDFALMQGVGALTRVKWEIQETVLVARLTYERIQNTSGGNVMGARSIDNGQVVAEFTIQSHFDVQRDYNPQTGEQLNLVVENTTDRPWYEREFFRVDWSKNLVTDAYDFDPLAAAAGFDSIKYDPLSYYIEDPKDPNAPVFSESDGYLDVTTKVFATPQTVDTPYGTLPACGLNDRGTYPAFICAPAEVTIRLAFKKVVDDDFEPEDWDGNKMSAFGWFEEDRYGYDRNYGIVDQKWHRFAAKYNIWKKSHVDGSQCAIDRWRDASGNVARYKVGSDGNFVADPTTGLPVPDPNGQPYTKSAVGQDVHRDTNGNKTEDECEFYDANMTLQNPGSRCDEFTNKCDIPLYARTAKTIPFYYGPRAAPDLFPSTFHALNSWNLAVKRAVQIGKTVEAARAKVDLQAPLLTSEADLAADQQQGKTVPDVFVLCHNPVIKGDHPACGAEGLAVRLGDLRYNVVDIVPGPQLPSPWGVMADFNDPLTGEKVQASINEWGAVLDIASQNTEDLVRWINGEIGNDQIANGQYMQQWVSGSKLGTGQYLPNALSAQQIQSRLNSIDRSSARLNGLPAGQKLPATVAAKLAAQNLSQTLGPSMDAQLEATRQMLLDTPWEAQLITPDMLQLAGYDPRQPFAGDKATLTQASPLRGQNRRLTKWANDMVTRGLLFKNMCMFDEEPEPDSLVGLARQASRLFPVPKAADKNYPAELFQRDQSLHQWIREQFHLSVIAHEMGHSMGLRHNFAGSFDALNYHTEYWQVRTRNGAEHYCGYPGPLDASTPHVDGTACVGPRWVDPVTEQESNDLLWKWASTSVMDYPGDQTQDMNDIGLYDKAAMRFGYADLVDVETNMKYSPVGGATAGTGADYLQAVDGFGGIFGNSIAGQHYSTYADRYRLLGDCSRPTAGWNGDPADPLAKQCTGPSLDYVARRDMKTVDQFSPSYTAVLPQLVANFAVDPQNRVRHPYMFGGDEFADVGNVPVFRFDAGADSYEQMQFLVSTYENRYIFNDFRRNQVLFNSQAVVNRLKDRYWDKIQAMTKSLALGVELLSQPGNDPTADPGRLMPLSLGAADGFAMFVRALTRPAPGPYITTQGGVPSGPPNSWAGVWQLGDQNATSPPPNSVNVALGNGQGRFLHNDYDYTQGYFWADYQKQVGTYYEKSLVPEYLTEAYNNFISNSEDDYIDGRYKNLSYMSLYPNQVRRLLANLMATQSATQVLGSGTVAQIFTLAPYSLPGPSTQVANPVTDVQYLPWDLYDPSDPSTTQLEYPQGAVLLDPLIGWEVQYPALVSLFKYAPTSLSMDFVDQMRILEPGDSASFALAPSAQIRFRDPVNGTEYIAKNYGTETVNSAIGFPVQKGIGGRMLQHANYLAQLAYQVSQPPDPVTGELTYDADAQGNPIPLTSQDAQNAATLLKGYTSNIDVTRNLTRFFNFLSNP